MLVGKVKQALSYINNSSDVSGVHDSTAEILQILKEKHPTAQPASQDVLLSTVSPSPQPVIFENITPELVQKSSMSLNGSGGPTLIDSDAWKHILCCKSYARESLSLAEAIANTAKRVCTENIHPC